MLNIKSSVDALEFWVDTDTPYTELWEQLNTKMAAMRSFYKGSTSPAHFFGKKYTDLQKKEIRAFLQEDIGIHTVAFAEDGDIVEPPPAPLEVSQDIFFRGTLRSGQRLESEGNIVIVGDVNAGAEVIANGNIVVFGKLRGLAHAGADGRSDAMIAANGLLPQQVRVGGKIAIIPNRRRITGPEIVRVQEGKIIVDQLG